MVLLAFHLLTRRAFSPFSWYSWELSEGFMDLEWDLLLGTIVFWQAERMEKLSTMMLEYDHTPRTWKWGMWSKMVKLWTTRQWRQWQLTIYLGPSAPSFNPLNQNQWLHRFEDHTSSVKALAWCPFQSNLLASGGGDNDRCIKFWNTHTGACLKPVHTGSQVWSLLGIRRENCQALMDLQWTNWLFGICQWLRVQSLLAILLEFYSRLRYRDPLSVAYMAGFRIVSYLLHCFLVCRLKIY